MGDYVQFQQGLLFSSCMKLAALATLFYCTLLLLILQCAFALSGQFLQTYAPASFLQSCLEVHVRVESPAATTAVCSACH